VTIEAMSGGDEEKVAKVPWKEGFFKMGDAKAMIFQTSDNKLIMKNLVALDYPDIEVHAMAFTCYSGNFGAARPEVAEATGVDQLNFLAESFAINIQGVINEEGTKITVWGLSNKLEEWVWLTPEAIQELKDDRDDIEAPSCPHITPQPGKAGKVVWLSGPPGSGKSTTCQLLATNQDYIYYEADCTCSLINPFVDLNADNPSVAAFMSKPLKGASKELAETILVVGAKFEECLTQNKLDEFSAMAKPFYKIMADDISKQKERLGGTFAVAHAVATRDSRDYLRGLMGPDLIFVVLNMSKDCMRERLTARHGETLGEGFENMYRVYEPAGEDEPNAHNVTIEKGMSKEDVINKVLDIMKNNP